MLAGTIASPRPVPAGACHWSEADEGMGQVVVGETSFMIMDMQLDDYQAH